MSFSPNQALKYIESFFLPPIGLIKHDIRLVGPTLQALNFLTFFEAKHCSGSYWIKGQTFLSTGGNALWMIISPDPKTILSGLLRPKSYRKIRRFERDLSKFDQAISDAKIVKVLSKDGKIRGGFRLLFEDKGTLIGDLIAALAKPIKAITSNEVGHFAFKIIDKNLTLGWYGFLAEVGEDGIINWASSVIKIEAAEHCGDVTADWSASLDSPIHFYDPLSPALTFTDTVLNNCSRLGLQVSANGQTKGFAVATISGTYSTSIVNAQAETWRWFLNSGTGQSTDTFTLSGPSGEFAASTMIEWDRSDTWQCGINGGPGSNYDMDTCQIEMGVIGDYI